MIHCFSAATLILVGGGTERIHGREFRQISFFEKVKRLTIGLPLAFKLDSGISCERKEYTLPKEEKTSKSQQVTNNYPKTPQSDIF